ncbi:MAG: biotin--[acetyl-CoA-carboxylase] ligase [Oscillospiraceae bacterium]|nr:biotin--[acetyl-CoA-carboxylase] ligase [Oscillospiraceae bacterium]
MPKEAVLKLLMQAEDYISGERMSETLGVSRAAVWKSVESLRGKGYTIEAVRNRGYRLLDVPDVPLSERVWSLLASDGFCREIRYLDKVDSTNSYLKRQAASGALHGAVAVAEVQTGGRGRMGRGFVSSAGKGLFFSVLLRPEGVMAQSITALTAFAAVAVCEAIVAVCPVEPKIKWVNDILAGDRKLAGILSEMGMDEMGRVDYVVIGAGINVHYSAEDFPAEIRERATSLAMLCENPVSRVQLAAAMIDSFARMYEACLTSPKDYVVRYRALSATVGREILVLRGEEQRPAYAAGLSDDCGLVVRYADGSEETLRYGEASIRGDDGGYI